MRLHDLHLISTFDAVFFSLPVGLAALWRTPSLQKDLEDKATRLFIVFFSPTVYGAAACPVNWQIW